MFYSRALMNQSEFEKAEEILKKLSIRRKYDPQVWYWLAEVQGLSKNIVGLHQSRSEYFYLKGSYDQAIEHLRYALEIAGNNFQLSESIRTKIENIHLTKESLKNIWKGKVFSYLRNKHLNDEYSGLYCNKCLNNVECKTTKLIQAFE